MNVVLSALFGGGLVMLIYGLTFIPSATLVQNDDSEETIELVVKKRSKANVKTAANEWVDRLRKVGGDTS